MVMAINHGIAAVKETDLRNQDIGEAIDAAITRIVKTLKVTWIERGDERGDGGIQSTTRRVMVMRWKTKRLTTDQRARLRQLTAHDQLLPADQPDHRSIIIKERKKISVSMNIGAQSRNTAIERDRGPGVGTGDIGGSTRMKS
jgi:hypothetical protein